MKANGLRKVLVLMLTLGMLIGSLAACGQGGGSGQSSAGNTGGGSKAPQSQSVADNGGDTDKGTEASDSNGGSTASGESKGTIMWLSNVSSGRGLEVPKKVAEYFCEQLGYNFSVVYGDSFNDPAGNLTAVKNGMTKDVKAIILSQDGGVVNIMEEYPELYVVGYNTDMASVYDENGASHAVMENEKWLGTMVDGFADGTDRGKMMFDAAVEKGYRKVSIIAFPAYAYPQHTVAANAFIAAAEEYNKTAADDDKFEIVGETKILEFSPLEDGYFLDENYSNLDAIVAMCAGVDFVYPTMKSAMASGTCSADTKLMTGGFNDDEEIIADIGGDGVIQFVSFSPWEDMFYPLVLIDNALNGTQYADFKPERVDALPYTIDSTEDIENVMTKAFGGSGNLDLLQWPWENVSALLTHNNPEATHADLIAAVHADSMSVEALADR